MKLEIITQNADETINAAKALSKAVKSPKVITLSGDLGAGKTTFTKGFGLGLGINEIITSPTFTLLNQYDCPDGRTMYHFDMYRLGSDDEAIALGFDEYFRGVDKNSIILVEWPEITSGILPCDRVEVKLEKLGETKRKITIKSETDL